MCTDHAATIIVMVKLLKLFVYHRELAEKSRECTYLFYCIYKLSMLTFMLSFVIVAFNVFNYSY